MAKTAAARNTLDASAHSPELAALAAAFQHVAIGMAVVSPDGRMVDVNPALCQMLGYERDEELGRDIAAIAAPDGCADVHSEWLRLAAGEIDGFLCETCFDHKAGSVVRGLVTVSVLRDDDGRRIGALAQVQDITAQKAAEAAAREREARLVALAGQLPVALYSLEPGADGAFHFVSPLFEHLTGLGPDELPKSFAELLARVHPDDRAAVLAADELAGRTGEPAQLQYRLRGGNDEWIWVENRSVPMRNERGTPRVWHGALLDISAQMRLKESLQESETRFRHAFEDAAIGMSLGNADHICLDANAAYCRIVGRPRAALIGRPFAEFTHPDDLEAYMRQVARLHAGEIDAYEIEKRYPRPDGTVVTGLLTVSAVRDDVGNFLYDIGQLQDITAQKEAEAALRENETRLRKLVEHLPAALYRQDAPADGSATYVSPNFATLLGLDPGDFPLGFSTFFERVHPEDRTAVTQAAAHAERTGEPMDVEYRLQRGDGEWTWIHDRSVLERDAAGQPRTWTGVLLDIGERKRLEASLRESEAHLRTIIEQAPAAVYRLEPGASGRFTYASPRFAALTGISLDRRNGSLEAYFARVHPDDVALLREKDAAAGRTGEPFDFEYRLRGQDSAWIWVHDRSTLERDEAGNPVAWHGVLLDVSERRTLESSLRESEARFRSIFEGAGIGMALSVPEGVMVLANPALETLLGYAPGELVGVRIADISEPEDFARQAGPQRLMRTGELDAFQFEKRFVRKDGGIVWGLLNATSVKDEQGVVTAVIGQVQDITARKEAEAALRASEARFRALVQNDPDVVVIVDDAMTIAYVSPSSLTAFGVPPDALLGPTKDNVHRVHAADLERGLALFGEVDGRPGAIASAEIRIKHRHHGWRWFQSTVANLLDDPGITGYLINLRDITDRKQAALASEAALKTQRAAIAELERLNQS
ncbi:MAG: PAS domain-containing protein, partial [Thermomicrobiales bacterium]